ncbi:hypothetical protein RhiJN_28477 [Ceratobasidium sp. AG-Ba]|nr:hypothetical protein RhiJN_28477 [Ceratobasidium sp. AG-Ba]
MRPGQVVTSQSELRPDSPAPEVMDHDELEQYNLLQEYEAQEERLAEEREERMMDHARALSLADLEAYGRETREFLDRLEYDMCDITPRIARSRSRFPSPSLTLTPEYDSNGRLTARSKGKGCAD